ncbi:MAG: hypothetical protein NVSMB1_24300 [Polyangiales bacterium]
MTGAQYCLLAYSGSIFINSKCIDLPMGCKSCPCAQTDAPMRMEKCGGTATLTCSDDGGLGYLNVLCDNK